MEAYAYGHIYITDQMLGNSFQILDQPLSGQYRNGREAYQTCHDFADLKEDDVVIDVTRIRDHGLVSSSMS